MRRLSRTTLIICAVFWAIEGGISSVLAQTAAPITSSGLNTQITLSTTPSTSTAQYNITGGTRAGSNLFHSFGEFSVPSSTIANFLNESGSTTANILGRVTGGNVSNILGTIQTTGFGSANVFLMNPAGIVFGPTASLNIGGSVTFTTADYLRLGENGRFNSIPNATSDALLSSAPVAAYGFLRSSPGSISVHGSQLTVSERQRISLFGGNISVESGQLESGIIQPAHLSAPNGHINLAATQSPGELLQDFTAAPNTNGTSFTSYGSAHLTPGSIVDFSQTGNGSISIRGGQLVLDIHNSVLDTTIAPSPSIVAPNQDTILLAPGSSVVSRTFSADRSPDIQLVADRLQFIGNADPRSLRPKGPPVTVLARTNGSGDAGNVTLRTSGNLELMNYVQIDSSAGLSPDGTALSSVLAPGNAGNVDLTSTQGNIRMTGFATVATSQAGNSSGTAGTVTASAPEGEILLDGANLFTFASSPTRGGGQVTVTARDLRMMNFGLMSTDNESQFKQGGITVTLSGNLEVTTGSAISAFSVSGAPAGDITLTAKDVVVTQDSIVNNAAFASGAGGHLKIVTDTLHVTDGAQLSSGSTRAPNRGRLLEILGDIKPSGPGGDITVQTPSVGGSVTIDGEGSGIFADTEGSGAGGNIFLTAGQSVSVSNGGTISAGSTGSGNAGSISINAGQQLDLHDGASIQTTTQSVQANGGNITIQAIDRVRLVNNSEISTSVNGEAGNGGNIFIDPKVVVLQGSEVTAKAVGGAGGNITFVTPLFLADSASLVSASSERGPSGTVTIQSPTSNLSGAVGQLVSKIAPPQILLQDRCIASAPGTHSTFILAGRDTLPTEPGGWLSSPVAMDHWTGEEGEEHVSVLMVRSISRNQSSAMIASTEAGQTLSLRRLTPPGFLVRTFATGLTGCLS